MPFLCVGVVKMGGDPAGNVTIVLVSPKTSANVGAAARAMNCMGLERLAVVSPRCQIDREAFSLAVGSDSILENAVVTDDLESFLSGFSLVVGTTRKTGKRRLNFVTAAEFASDLLPLHASSRTAVLFGAEDYGLPMSCLRLCQHLVHIPVSPGFGSLNLSQAVMVVCYEIRKSFDSRVFSHGREEADAEDMRILSEAVDDSLRAVRFPESKGAFSHASHLKEILSRASLKKFEVHMLLGLARHARFLAGRIERLEKS